MILMPEMVDAGTEALQEARTQGLKDEDTVKHVFTAMRAVEEMAVMHEEFATKH